jgi:hypothetical protein
MYVMKSLSRFFLLVLTALLTACATVQPLPKEVVAKLQRVGVVSHTGGTLYKQYIGVTVFGNEKDTQEIGSWRLDEVYEKQVAEAVQRVFAAQPLVLAAYRDDFAAVNSLNGPYSAEAFWGPNFEKIAAATRRACTEQDLDAVVVLARWQSTDLVGATNQKVEGTGVYARRTFAYAYVMSKIGFLDCASGKPLSVGLLLKPGTSPHNIGGGVVRASFSPDVAGKPLSTWSAPEREELRNILSELPREAWEATLRGMLPSR